MFRTLFLMLVLLAGLVAGPYLSGKQGYVLIETNSFNIEMSLTTLVILFVIAMAIVYAIEWVITRFFRLSNNTYGWFSNRKRRKAQKQTIEGLIRMQAGDYSKAEKLIGKNAKHADEPVFNFIKAAEAAQQRGDEFSANNYLLKAAEIAGSDSLVVEIARTKILLQQNKLPAARSAVDSLLEMTSRNKEVLKLAVDIYLRSHAYQALDNILDQIENTGLYSTTEFNQLQQKIEDGLLDEKMNEYGVDGLIEWWNNQPKKRRNDLYVKIGLIRRLVDCDDHETANELALETLKKIDDSSSLSDSLCLQISRLQPTDNSKLIKILEKRIRQIDKTQSCCIYRCLGYLYVRNGDFAKASNAFKQVIDSNSLEPNDTTMVIYAFEQNGDADLAEQVRHSSLQSAMAVKNIHYPASKTKENSTALSA
ncbi:heme biosynthesis HemY N-terminal domain-containing protein [Seminibacterium arietis]|uniref:Heme biosynthesis HemY N-terminal domain-containing protein n=1 Tax=Seminibacterium arietis TaxID=1173502 RepID=A0ABW3I8E6_9PAST